jgi:hypothetical protein
MELLTDQPFWYLLLCAGIGASYAFLLYRKDTLLNEVKTWVKGIMAFFRFITIGFLCFLLLSPFLKIINRHIEKPIIVFAQDNSESIGTTKDSLYYKNEYPKQFSKSLSL